MAVRVAKRNFPGNAMHCVCVWRQQVGEGEQAMRGVEVGSHDTIVDLIYALQQKQTKIHRSPSRRVDERKPTNIFVQSTFPP